LDMPLPLMPKGQLNHHRAALWVTTDSVRQETALKVSQDAYKGDAQYTVSVDGKQIGGVLTAGASHTAGHDDIITVKGDWATGTHKLAVNFLNDSYGGSAAADRYLHVDGITYNGAAVAKGTADLHGNGPVFFSFVDQHDTAHVSSDMLFA